MRDHLVDGELSIGDVVLAGGEVAAMVVLEAVGRLVPGVMGNAGSSVDESFTSGLLEGPHYTRPEEIDGLRVPATLLGGNHAEIRRWRLKQALGRTWLRRPDLLQAEELDSERVALLAAFIEEYKQS